MAAVDLVKDRVARYKIDCDLTFGYVDAAYHQRQMAELDEMQREWEARGYDGFTRLDDRAALGAHVDTDAYVGGLFDSKSGHMQPLKYLHGLAAAAQEQGAVIHENTPIKRLRPTHPMVLNIFIRKMGSRCVQRYCCCVVTRTWLI